MSGRIHYRSKVKDQTPTETDVSYCAGFFDGEGCIHISRQTYQCPSRRPTLRLCVDVGQNNLRVLLAFIDKSGVPGRVYQVARTSKQNRDCYALKYEGNTAAQLLEVLMPYLIRKLPEAELALEFLSVGQVSRHFGPKGCPKALWIYREQCYRRMKRLK